MDWLTVQIIDFLTPSKVVRIRLETTLVCDGHGLETRWPQDDGLSSKKPGFTMNFRRSFKMATRSKVSRNAINLCDQTLWYIWLVTWQSMSGDWDSLHYCHLCPLLRFKVHNWLCEADWAVHRQPGQRRRGKWETFHFPELLCYIT